METEVRKKLFTVEEYHRMAEAGILRGDDRLELIDGEIIQMSPIGNRHSVCVNRANTFFIQALGSRAVVSPQGPLRLAKWTEVQPDIVLFKPRADFYAKHRPVPADVLLIIEVSDTTLRMDQKIKLPKYSGAGITEYWIEDLQHDRLLVHRDPNGRTYDNTLVLGPDDFVACRAFPDVKLSVGELLSTDFED